MKVILSGLLDSSWGNFHRSTIVRLTVYGNHVKIGVAEGNLHQWELDALRDTPIEHEWISIEMPETQYVEGIKYISEKKVSDMPRGFLPVQSRNIFLFVSDEMRMVFPAYRCFDIDFGNQRILSILSPKTLVKDAAEATHPAFPKEKYHGRVHNVEVKAEALGRFLNADYGIGMLGKRDVIKGEIKAFPLLGGEDMKVILNNIRERLAFRL